MPQIDPVWQLLIPAVIGIGGIYLTYRLGWKVKAFSYDVLSSTPVFNVEEVKGKLQILFNGRQVEDPWLFILRLINTGNVPIESRDYEHPVTISFGEKAQILTAELTQTNPKRLTVQFNNDGTRVLIDPCLLNHGDWFTLRMLVARPSMEEMRIDGRIVGVKEIRKAPEIPRRYVALVISSFILIGVGGIASFVVYFAPLSVYTIYAIATAGAGYLLAGISGLKVLLILRGREKLRQA